jgi:hypothetical protein
MAWRIATALGVAVLLMNWPSAASAELKYQYWATSLSGEVDPAVLRGFYEAVDRGEIGWLDVDAQNPLPRLRPAINLILYHVGGNCYIGSDCDRFPSSEPTGDQWGNSERVIDLNEPATRKIVVEDIVVLMQHADETTPPGAIIGMHLDNVHRLDARGLAEFLNAFLKAIDAARREARISSTRDIGYVAKNNPAGFKQALDMGLLDAIPLFQINENARLSEDGTLDPDSRIAQQIGEQYQIPVFLKTFGSDVAYKVEEDGVHMNFYVSQDMARRMAELPNVAGVAWSADEASYHPTLFVQGSPAPAPRRPLAYRRSD